MKPIRIAAVAALVLLAAALSGVAQPEQAQTAQAEPPSRSVTVNGLGSVAAVPDEAEFSFGVETQGATAREALAANSREMQRVVAALRSAGVGQRDIRTSIVSVSPRYSEDGRANAGFVAMNSVSATLRDLGRAGAVIDAAVNSGANVVGGPSLGSSSRERLYRQALRAAVEDARAKAEELAAAAGGSVGRVVTLTESGAAPSPIAQESAAGGVASDARAVVIAPGTQEIQASVTVTFELV